MEGKYHGTFPGLRRIVRHTGHAGRWRKLNGDRQHQFKADTGEVLNWWPSTGTVQAQGHKPERFVERLNEAHLNLMYRRAERQHHSD